MTLEKVLEMMETLRVTWGAESRTSEAFQDACNALWKEIDTIPKMEEKIEASKVAIQHGFQACRTAVKVLADINPAVRDSEALHRLRRQQAQARIMPQLARPRGALIAELLENQHKLASFIGDADEVIRGREAKR